MVAVHSMLQIGNSWLQTGIDHPLILLQIAGLVEPVHHPNLPSYAEFLDIRS